jgi:hypothetical protein
MSDLTYGRLDEVLRSVGFSMRGEVKKNKVYVHEATGALITFPVFPDGDEVHPRYLEIVRAILRVYDIASPLDLAARPQSAS